MQFYEDKLTIILTLKDREEFTFRYLKYLDAIKFPFQVLIVDGGKFNPDFEAAMLKKENFPNVRYEYIRFPEDKTLMDFYNKVLKTLEMVQTPYIMFNDNDDFPLPMGINCCIEFLERDHEYVSAGGKLGGVVLVNKFGNKNVIYGKVYNWHEYYCHADSAVNSSEQRDILDRVRNQILFRNDSFYYNVCRREPLIDVYRSAIKYNLNDLLFWEYLIIQMPLVYGKVKMLPYFYTYIRQRGTSCGAKSGKIFWDSLYLYKWMDTFDRYVEALALSISSANGKSLEEVEWDIKEMYSAYRKSMDFESLPMKIKLKILIRQCWYAFDDKIRFMPCFLKKWYLCQKLGYPNLFGKKEFSRVTKQIERLISNKILRL